jgi:hypothetical protein
MGEDNGTGSARGRALDQLRSLIGEVEGRLQVYTTKCAMQLLDDEGVLGTLIWKWRHREQRWCLLFQGLDEVIESMGNTPTRVRLESARQLAVFVAKIRHKHVGLEEIDDAIEETQQLIDSLDYTVPIAGEVVDG